MEYFLDPLIRKQLDNVRERVLTKDIDFTGITDGEVGSGKSVLTMQIAKYLDPEFNIDKVCFTALEFIKIIRDPNTKKGSAIIMDEAFASSSSRQSLSQVNHAINSLAMEMRQRNLFIFFVIPSYFDLDRIIALHRSRALFHVYFAPDGSRRYIVFDRNAKKKLYLIGKKNYSYNKPKASFPPARFDNYYTIDEQEYRKKKAIAFEERPKVSKHEIRWLGQRDALVRMIMKEHNYTVKEFNRRLTDEKGIAIDDKAVKRALNYENTEIP